MNWEAIGALSELIGAFAVVLSLIYVALQVRQNTRATRAETARATAAAFRDFNKAMMSDPRMASIWVKAPRGLSHLTDEEHAQFIHLVHNFYRLAEDLYYQFRNGTATATGRTVAGRPWRPTGLERPRRSRNHTRGGSCGGHTGFYVQEEG